MGVQGEEVLAPVYGKTAAAVEESSHGPSGCIDCTLYVSGRENKQPGLYHENVL